MFNMYGGVISYNEAAGDTSDGGGISVAPKGTATLYAGYFYNNRAGQHGGAIGTGWAEGNKKSTTILYNPVIAGNRATGMGGGFYGCPEGTVANMANGRTAIFENSVTNNSNDGKASQDVRVDGGNKTKNNFVIPTTMLNGASYDWTSEAGKEFDKNKGFNGTNKYQIDGVEYPFNVDCDEAEILAIIEKLKAEFPAGSVFIVNNFANGKSGDSGSCGGGVGGNGSWVVLGEDTPDSPTDEGMLNLKKTLAGEGADTDKAFGFKVTFEHTDSDADLSGITIYSVGGVLGKTIPRR
jgi:hypothetical protein